MHTVHSEQVCVGLGFSKDIQNSMYDHTLFYVYKSDIRPHVKWVPPDAHFLIFLMGLCWYVWVNIFTFSPLRIQTVQNRPMHGTSLVLEESRL